MTFLKYAFFRNVWLWFHMLGGALIARVANVWMEAPNSLMLVLFVALVWEIAELILMTLGVTSDDAYGNGEVSSGKHFFMDSCGDVLGAVFMAALVLI